MNHIVDFFPRLINMSAIASIVILFVLVVRLILKRAPKIFSYALWAIVLIRLLVPVHIPSPISAIPVTQTTNSAEINAALPPLDFETPGDRQENSLSLQQSIEKDTPYVHVSHSLEPTGYLAIVWLAGMGVMVLYSCLSYWKIKKKVRISVLLRDNIFIADDIGSPCVIGFGLPNIYLPNGLSEKEQKYIILHEQHHIKRLDHIVKGLAFVALTIHWFNPLVWVAFILACKDMEMSCDEAVVRKLGSDVRADYSASLLTLAKRKHRAPLRRRTAILIAALIAMMALSVTAFASEFIQNWFVSFFAEKSNSALTQEQVNYIEENAQNINEVQTQDNWNVELKSAITDGDIAYIVIGVTAPEGVSLEQRVVNDSVKDQFRPGNLFRPPEEGKAVLSYWRN